MSIYILVKSNGAPQRDWLVQPTVILAILAATGSALLHYFVSNGLVVYWWTLALRGAKIEKLHHSWSHGNSVLSAINSGTRFDLLAAVKILVASSFVVEPLLQRASQAETVVVASNNTIPFSLATNVASFLAVNFTGAYTDGFSNPIQLMPSMVQVMRDYTNRAPIQSGFYGSCVGNCSGTVRAAGIVANCTSVSNDTFDITYKNGHPLTVFQTGTNIMNYHTHEQFNLSVFTSQTEVSDRSAALPSLWPCSGSSTTKICALQHAVLEYPITMTNNTLTVHTRPSEVRTIYREENGEVAGVGAGYREPVFDGFSIAANSITQSVGQRTSESRYGFLFNASGPLTSFYVDKFDPETCAMSFSDPTDDILTSFNEILFRISIAAFANTTSRMNATDYTFTQHASEIHYKSHFQYLIAATIISLVAIASVLPTFHGFWRLGRDMSLSPIEIAKAFDAPLLREQGTSNMPIHNLLHVVGKTKVKYGCQCNVMDKEQRGDEEESGEHVGDGEILRIDGADVVARPRKGMMFGG